MVKGDDSGRLLSCECSRCDGAGDVPTSKTWGDVVSVWASGWSSIISSPSALEVTLDVLWPGLEGCERVRDGTLFVREAEPDFEFGDGERRMCNRSRKEGRGLKVPDDVS